MNQPNNGQLEADVGEQVWDGVNGKVIIVPSFSERELCEHGLPTIYICAECQEAKGLGIYDVSEMD